MENNNFNLFQQLDGFGLILFAGLSLLVFAYMNRFSLKKEELYKMGRANEEEGSISEKKPTFLQDLTAVRKRLHKDKLAGIYHDLIMFGLIFYIFAFIGTVLQTLLSSFTEVIIFKGIALYIYQIMLNVGIVFVFAGSLIAILRRLLSKMYRLEKTARHFIPIIAILAVSISASIHEGFKLLLHKDSEVLYLAGLLSANLINALKLTPEVFNKLYYTAFLFNFLLTLAIIVLWHSTSKLSHMTAGVHSCGNKMKSGRGRIKNTEISINKFFREDKELDDSDEEFGLKSIGNFSSLQLLEIDSCAECGRCDSVCPAFKSGKSLSPQKMMEKQKNYLNLHDKQEKNDILSVYPELSETVWECNMCYACEFACPSIIDHVDKTIGLRRNLVLNSGVTTQEFKKVIRNIGKFQNPYGIDNSARFGLLRELEIPLLKKGEKVDFVLWIGCHGYFDARMKTVVRNLKNLLHRAGKSFAVFENETCCGDVVRRIGDEFKFQEILSKNLSMIKEYEVENILTICPHCYSSLKNEYSTFGSTVKVSHYIEILHSLIEDKIGTFKQNRKRVFYHDSCYLGRINGLYNQPREILKLMNGECELLSIPCEKEDSLCCGGGGGRIWVEENVKNRPSMIKLEEILKKDIDTIVTSCPYCLNIFSDAVLTSGKEIEVKDLLEITGEFFNRIGGY